MPATLPYYRLLRALVSGKRILDHGADPLGAALLRESGNQVGVAPAATYDIVLSFDQFRAGSDPRAALNGLRHKLSDGGVFAVSCRVAPTTGVADPDSGELAFRLETAAKLLQDYFRIVTYAFLHGDEIRAEWDQYSNRVVFFCRFLKPTQLAQSNSFLEELDSLYGGTIKGLVPFSLPYLRAWLNRDSGGVAGPKGNLLFFLQPLPLYNDPLLYQSFFERYYLLGEEYRDLGWNVFYSATSELKSLYGAEHAFCPQDFRHPPHIPDWRAVFSKTLDAEVQLDDPDIAYWAEYIGFLLDQSRPDAIFVWNKNALLDRIAADRGILVIHNEVCLDRNPRPRTFFFDPQGVNAESALRLLWERFRHLDLPDCCYDLVAAFRRCYVDPWLGSASRAEILHSLALDPNKKTILIPLQVENDSNVLHNSPFQSMTDFCQKVLSALPRGKFNVIIKPHPANPLPTHLTPTVASRARVVDAGRAIGPLIQASDCVFTISSTTGYEALLAGKPVVTFGRSVYSHLGFTVDLEALGKKSRIDPPLCCLPSKTLDKFIFLASMFYPLSERTISSARLQEPLLLRALECKRRDAAIYEYWHEPATFDWERFCFDKMAEWLEGSRSLGGYVAPSAQPAVSEEILLSVKSVEQEQATLLAELEQSQDSLDAARNQIDHLQELGAESAAEISRLQHDINALARERERQTVQLLLEQEKTRQFAEFKNANAGLHKSVTTLRADLVREKRQAEAARNAADQFQTALAEVHAAARLFEKQLVENAAAAARELDLVTHNNAHLRQQLDSEADKNRILAAELLTARTHSSEMDSIARNFQRHLEEAENRRLRSRVKRTLHRALDAGQRLAPESLRRLVRPLYLEHVYYRVYPEKRPSTPVEPAPIRALATGNHAATISSYRPYLELKERLYGGLPLDFKELSAGSTPRLVSVVLPVYNGARYVAYSIESILRQTYSNLELIIVDDGSTDDTPRILDRYSQEPRVRIVQQANQKLPAALNTGFAHAQGEYRTWTSDDNIMLPEMLSELVDFLDCHQDTEMVYADQELIDDDGEPLVNSDYCPGYQTPPGGNMICWPRDPGELNFVQNNYFGGCFLYRAWAGELVGDYCTSSFLYEDYDYWMRMNALFRVKHFGQRRSLYKYRLHWQSLSAREQELKITEQVRDFMAFESARRALFTGPFDITFLGAHPWFAEMAQAYRHAGHNVFEAKDWSEKTRYQHTVTRAFSKHLVICGSNAPAIAPPDSVIVTMSNGEDPRVQCTIGAKRLHAASARNILYPVLAAANSAAYAHWRDNSSHLAALQHA